MFKNDSKVYGISDWEIREDSALQAAKLWDISNEGGIRNESCKNLEMGSGCCEIHVTLRSWESV